MPKSHMLYNLAKCLVYFTSGKRLKVIFLLLLVIWLLSSCRLTLEKCEQKFGPCGHITPLEVVTTVKDTTYITKGDTVMQTFFVRKTDTITVEKFVEKFKSKLKTNADSRISLIWSNDSVLHIRAVCPPDTIVVEKAVVKTVKNQEKKVLVEKPVSWWDVIKYVVIGIFIGMILFLLFNLIRKLLVW